MKLLSGGLRGHPVADLGPGDWDRGLRHQRSFARHRTITDLAHARALRAHRGQPDAEPAVEVRPLARYDALIA
jgi:hypothetical protein